jgi:hypothetical protein
LTTGVIIDTGDIFGASIIHIIVNDTMASVHYSQCQQHSQMQLNVNLDVENLVTLSLSCNANETLLCAVYVYEIFKNVK